MSAHIEPVLVRVTRVDHSYDHPDKPWLVILIRPQGPLGLVVGHFSDEDDARTFANGLASLNRWSVA